MFETITPGESDKILALMGVFRADPRPEKVDLVVGVYKDAEGRVPVMRAVKAAEARLQAEEDSKTYVGIAGDAAFCGHVGRFLLGDDAPQLQDRVATLQTVGGSAALRVGCDLLASLREGQRIWVGTPTWANHVPVAQAAGLEVREHPYFRAEDRGLDFDGMVATLEAEAEPGDAIILHGCCHNPTGVDMSLAQWRALTDLVLAKGLIPFVDCAYQGLGDGLEADVEGLRHMAGQVPEMLIASSYSKNFALYRERTGALTIQAATPDALAAAFAATEAVIRPNYSMPPSHGARVVTTILGDDGLRSDWRAELDEMRARIAEMRRALRAKLEERQVSADLSFLTQQVGMFSYTGFTPADVDRLRDGYGIYIAGDGRINVAGLSPGTLDHVADGFAECLRRA